MFVCVCGESHHDVFYSSMTGYLLSSVDPLAKRKKTRVLRHLLEMLVG